MKTCLAFLTAITALGCSVAEQQVNQQAQDQNIHSYNVTVTTISNRPILSGVIATWIVIDARISDSHEIKTIFIPYLSHDQGLPKIKERCTVRAEMAVIEGMTSFGGVPKNQKSLIAKSFVCNEKELVPVTD